MVDGIKQAPIEGTSFVYTFDAANAKVPTRHNIQYFEMMGQWALYKDGWLLSTKVNRAPWEAFSAANPDPLNNQVFQLYNLDKDFTQSTDIAAQNPQKVKEMRAAFGRRPGSTRCSRWTLRWPADSWPRAPTSPPGGREFVYTRPMVGLPQGSSPLLLNTSYTVTADITVPAGGAEGMILDLRRAVRRLRLLPAQGQAGLDLEPD